MLNTDMSNLIDVDLNNTEISDENDLLHKTETLTKTVHQLKADKKKIEEEFGVQRAKMKELYIQKEEELKQQLSDQNNLKSEIERLQAELNDTRSQLTVTKLDFQSKLEDQKTKSTEELYSLQRIIYETLEEINKYENEIKRLNSTNEKLISEINELKGNINARINNASSTGADMPQLLAVPGTVISSIARTVKSQISTQLGNSDSSNNNNNNANNAVTIDHHHHQPSSQGSAAADSLEECMRKVNKYAQEDAEVLRSVVVPLEEEIEALKDKLRVMDDELNQHRSKQTVSNANNLVNILPEFVDQADAVDEEGCYKNEKSSQHNVMSATDIYQISDAKANVGEVSSLHSMEEKCNNPTACPTCCNYETQLINAQQKINDLEKHITGLERYKQELNRETAFRKKMEETWNEKKEEYKEQVNTLQNKMKKAEETLRELHTTFTNTSLEFTQELQRLRGEREETQAEINRLQKENDDLLGKYSKYAEQLQNEPINLPNSVEELQEMVLNYQEELIMTKVSKEITDDQMTSLQCKVTELIKQTEVLKDVKEELNRLLADLYTLNGTSQPKELCSENIVTQSVSTSDIKQLRSQINNVIQSKRKMENTINELRTRVSSLQTELNNSETVQKDFVLLSQSLQQELERIRAVDSQVRWEHDDDINECPRCKAVFSACQKKQHCRHCGRIFCSACLSHIVHSGPNNRPSQVCDVCHTLLVRNTAPYFSTSVLPHSN